MSGKFLTCLVLISSSLILSTVYIYASEKKSGTKEGASAEKKEKKSEEKKEKGSTEKKPKKEEASNSHKKSGGGDHKEKTNAAPNYLDPKADKSNVYFLEREISTPTAHSESNKTSIKSGLLINGYSFLFYDNKNLAGIRAKAIGDLLLRRGSNSKAIKYYELALKNLKNEADIYFNLANIYFEEKVYNLAGRYYQIAEEKYLLPENYGKTQKYRYLSMIRLGFSLEKLRDEENNHKKAEQIVSKLRDLELEIYKEFPEVKEELYKLYRMVFGEVYIFIPKENLFKKGK